MDEYAAWAIRQYTKIWGKMAPEKLVQARLKICGGCSKAGKVQVPLPQIKAGWPALAELDGCTECGCPFATKPRVLRYFNPAAMKVQTAKCPLDKWPDPEDFEPKN